MSSGCLSPCMRTDLLPMYHLAQESVAVPGRVKGRLRRTLRVRALDSASARRPEGWLGVTGPRLIAVLIFAIVDPIYAIIFGGIRSRAARC
jgi:hypothetical protein